MILRRLVEHVRTQNWVAVALDFAIVVLGVFIGIQLGNWNEARRDSAAGDASLARMANNIASDIEALDRIIENLQREAEHAELIDRYLRGEEVANSDWEMYQIIYYRAGWTPFTPSRVAYDELISSGRYRLAGDVELRRDIAEYYAGLEDFALFYEFQPPLRALVRGQYLPQAQEYMWRTCFPDVHYRSGPGGFANCPPFEDTATVAQTLAAMRQDDELVEAVRYVHSIRLIVLGGAMTDRDEARTVLARIEEYLE